MPQAGRAGSGAAAAAEPRACPVGLRGARGAAAAVRAVAVGVHAVVRQTVVAQLAVRGAVEVERAAVGLLLQPARERRRDRHRVVAQQAVAHVEAGVAHADDLACALPRRARHAPASALARRPLRPAPALPVPGASRGKLQAVALPASVLPVASRDAPGTDSEDCSSYGASGPRCITGVTKHAGRRPPAYRLRA
jgi:hypothetical protein